MIHEVRGLGGEQSVAVLLGSPVKRDPICGKRDLLQYCWGRARGLVVRSKGV